MVGDFGNVGPKSRIWLAEIDIRNMDDLRAIGAIEAYARLRFRFGREITRNMLHGLAAALDGMDWRQLPAERKAEIDRQAEDRLASANLTEI